MKKLILTCALITSASMLSFAQSTQSSVTMTPANGANNANTATAQRQMPQPEQMADRRAKVMQKQYNLDDKQYQGVYNAELDYMKKMTDMRNKGQQPTVEQQQQMMMVKDAAYKAAMSPDQYTKYAASRPQQQMKPATSPAVAPANGK